MSVKDEKIANLTEMLSDIEESLHNCQQENVKLLEENKRLKQNAEGNETTIQRYLMEITTLETISEALENRINILEAALTFADARINTMMDSTATSMNVTNNYNIGKS
jgi:predicted nuclease with TOPRIM domain